MKVALITGGTTGIGFGIAKSLLAEGYAVAFTGRSEASVKKAETLLKGEILGIAVDVQDYSAMENAVKKVLAKWGRIDVLVANASIGILKNIVDLSVEEWDTTVGTNLSGVFYTVKAAVQEIIKTEGYIFTIGSLAGINFWEKGTAYNASKFGIVGFSQALMLDVREKGVKVTTIMPGSVASFFNNHVPNDADGWKIQPEDLGEMVIDLLKMNPRVLPSKVEVRPLRVKK